MIKFRKPCIKDQIKVFDFLDDNELKKYDSFIQGHPTILKEEEPIEIRPALLTDEDGMSQFVPGKLLKIIKYREKD